MFKAGTLSPVAGPQGGRRPAVTAGLAILLVASGAAWAHAALVKSAPGSRETLSKPPTRIVLKFSEAVEPKFSSVRLEDADGKAMPLGSLMLSPGDPTQIEIAVPQALPRGSYTVRYRVLSQDGHVVKYGYTFRVATPTRGND